MNRGKTICFIDNTNIYHGVASAGWRIDWKKFQLQLEKEGQIWQTHLFASAMSNNGNEKEGSEAFYHFCRKQLQWNVKLYIPKSNIDKCTSCGYTRQHYAEKGVDTGIVVGMLTMNFQNAYDTAVLVSGDSDLAECVNYIINTGKRVEVISWKNQLSKELADVASKITYIDDLKEDIIMTV